VAELEDELVTDPESDWWVVSGEAMGTMVAPVEIEVADIEVADACSGAPVAACVEMSGLAPCWLDWIGELDWIEDVE
jgi:hypothetical protein